MGTSDNISVGFAIELLLFIKVYIYIMCNCDNSKASNGLEGV
jgi:hypothetical protein